MKFNFVVIDLDLSRRAKRVATGVAVALLVAGVGTIAFAGVANTWADGDTMTAAGLNASPPSIPASRRWNRPAHSL
jgi:hypothetical protein